MTALPAEVSKSYACTRLMPGKEIYIKNIWRNAIESFCFMASGRNDAH